ncbi:MAG: fumarylacetoacetate hydrolase family protein [Muribaculaceae bacterium]|nr:fumarylacetoacetate hydrolase family protein [Muribaculaceae bacterium]
MKILLVNDIENNAGMRVRQIADSAIVASGKPLFVPDFAGRFSARLGLAVRIDRLGKHIDARFAHRYFQQVTVCCVVSGSDWADADVNPETDARALSFDGSLLMGNFQPYDGKSDLSLTLSIDGEPKQDWRWNNAAGKLQQAISNVSRYFTLKMGDLLICDSEGEQAELHIGGKLTAAINGNESLTIRLR